MPLEAAAVADPQVRRFAGAGPGGSAAPPEPAPPESGPPQPKPPQPALRKPAPPDTAPPDTAPLRIALSLRAEAGEVRRALCRLACRLDAAGLAPEDAAAAELVLAEALNNVVEHAFAGRAPGWIGLLLERRGADLACQVRDRGRPMPGGRLPAACGGPAPDPTTLPEGGFGWLLIGALTRDLAYARDARGNVLSFRLPLSAPPRAEPPGS
jgi:serine/threonine-protein kinase RsbW